MAGVGVVGLTGSAGATSSFSISRLAGPNRFATAAAIAAAAYPKGAATVILASGLGGNISDSLAASYLAGQLNRGAGAPILLTNPKSVPAETKAALKSLGATHVIVVGGSAAVSDSVVVALQGLKLSATRVSGADRFATAAAIDSVSGSDAVGTASGGAYAGQRFAIIADGQDANLVDSLGAAPVAFADHFPILLVNGPNGKLSSAQLARLKSLGPNSDVLILGGSGAVGTQVAAQVTANGQNPVNVAGANRTETSQALADFAIDNLGFGATSFDIASGDPAHLIDSLSGGPYGGVQAPPSPTLITTDVDNPGSVASFATEHAGNEASAVVFGGTAAVSLASLTTITTAGQPAVPQPAGVVNLINNSGAVGASISGTVSNPGQVASLTVSGCGLTNSPVGFNTTTGGFAVTIPGGAPAGPCTLTFTAKLTNGTTVTSTAVVMVTGAAPPPPPVGGSGGGPGSGLGNPPTGATAPVLVSARLVHNGFLQSADSVVAFTFSGPVTAGLPADFSLEGYNTSRPTFLNPASVKVEPANNAVVDATFAAIDDPTSYTIAVVQNTGAPANKGPAAVIGAGGSNMGLANPLGSVPLVGGGPTSTSAGPTTAPDLVSARVVAGTPTEVTYTFDKPVTGAPTGFGPDPLAANFGYYTSAGAPATAAEMGTGIVGFKAGSDTVTVSFGSSAVAAVRFFVSFGAVGGDARMSFNPDGAVGAGTASPDLVSVTPVPGQPTQLDFRFDKGATAGLAGAYGVYVNDDGGSYPGTDIVGMQGADTVRVDFAGPGGLDQANTANVTLGAVVEAAADGATKAPNTIGDAPISGAFSNGGLTDGPDLQGAVANVAANTVTYTFNQLVTAPVSKDFFVIDANGAPTAATSVGVAGETVVATFGAGVLATAVGAGIVGVTDAETTAIPAAGAAGAVANATKEPAAPGDVALG
ncbi:MAG: beta strand repeat-containing protein [Candidatus Dormibacteria bacterium]